MRGISFLFLIFASGPLWAANGQEGNGGDAVVCDNGVVETLDIFEARVLRSLEFDAALEGADELITAKNIFARLEVVDPLRGKDFARQVDAFYSETRLIENAGLADVPDSDHSIIPMGCAIKQLAIQREPQFPRDSHFIIDKSIWDQMDVRNKASLIVHEIVYREAIHRAEHKNSKRVRYYNSVLVAENPLLSRESYAELSQIMAFKENFALSKAGATILFVSSPDNLGKDQNACEFYGKTMAEFATVDEHRAFYPEMGQLVAEIFANRGRKFSATFLLKTNRKEFATAEFEEGEVNWTWNVSNEFAMCNE